MGLPEEKFTTGGASIEALRRSNKIADEICRDYEYLADLLRRSDESRHQNDIRASLSGLEAEIKQLLDKE